MRPGVIMVAARQPTNDGGPGPVTAMQRRLPLALIACSLALGAVRLATGAARHAVDRPGPRRGSHRPLRRPTLSDLIPRIAIAYDVGGRGSAGFNQLAWEGVKRAAGAFDAEIKEISAGPDDTDADREERLTELAEDRYYPIFAIGPTWAGQWPRSPRSTRAPGSASSTTAP